MCTGDTSACNIPLCRFARHKPDLGCVKLLSKRVRFSCLLQQMSQDTFLSEALYDADKALEKFAAAPWECACSQDGG